MSPENFSPLNNLTIGIYLELLAPPGWLVTIPSLKTYL
jgi:hypothetical protein